MSYQRPIFHDDGYGKYLLEVGPRYINVHQNWAGDYFFSPAFGDLALCNAARLINKVQGKPALYRIVVRPKAVSA